MTAIFPDESRDDLYDRALGVLLGSTIGELMAGRFADAIDGGHLRSMRQATSRVLATHLRWAELATVIDIDTSGSVEDRVDEDVNAWVLDAHENGEFLAAGCYALMPVICATLAGRNSSECGVLASEVEAVDDVLRDSAHDIGVLVNLMLLGNGGHAEWWASPHGPLSDVASHVTRTIRHSVNGADDAERAFKTVISEVLDSGLGCTQANSSVHERGAAMVAGGLLGGWFGFSRLPGRLLGMLSDSDLSTATNLSRLLLHLLFSSDAEGEGPPAHHESRDLAEGPRGNDLLVDVGGLVMCGPHSVAERVSAGALVVHFGAVRSDLRIPLSPAIVQLPWFANDLATDVLYGRSPAQYLQAVIAEHDIDAVIANPMPGDGRDGLAAARHFGWDRRSSVMQAAAFLRSVTASRHACAAVVPDRPDALAGLVVALHETSGSLYWSHEDALRDLERLSRL